MFILEYDCFCFLTRCTVRMLQATVFLMFFFSLTIYIIKQDIRIYMFPIIAGQSAGPNWLTFFEEPRGIPGVA